MMLMFHESEISDINRVTDLMRILIYSHKHFIVSVSFYLRSVRLSRNVALTFVEHGVVLQPDTWM